MKKLLRLIPTLALILLTACSPLPGQATEQLEATLNQPAKMTGKLTKQDIAYQVEILTDPSQNLFNIRFLSGDEVSGLTVEFFDGGSYISFDDLRFKTNKAFFTSLERLKNAYQSLAAPDTPKTIADTDINQSMRLKEVMLNDKSAALYINENFSSPLRLIIHGENSLTLDIESYESIQPPPTVESTPET